MASAVAGSCRSIDSMLRSTCGKKRAGDLTGCSSDWMLWWLCAATVSAVAGSCPCIDSMLRRAYSKKIAWDRLQQ
jgi:hypothetical protein